MDYAIDQKFLEEAGVVIDDKVARDAKIQELSEILELRVGTLVSEHLTEEQINEFEKIYEDNDEATNIAWLEKAYPEYSEEVKKAYDALKQDLKHGKV